jgi:hypothetical protein
MASSKRKSKQNKNGEKNSLNRNATGREIDVIGPMADIFISHKESGVNRRCAQALLYSRRGDMNTIENGNSQKSPTREWNQILIELWSESHTLKSNPTAAFPIKLWWVFRPVRKHSTRKKFPAIRRKNRKHDDDDLSDWLYTVGGHHSLKPTRRKKISESKGSDRFLPTCGNSSVSTLPASLLCVYYPRQYYV